jgi:alkyl hydroperoxide reductase subunit AhpC
MGVIAAGTKAPSFTLARADGGTFTEADLQGQRTVLVFYPFAFSPVCTDQLQLYEALLGELAEQGGFPQRALVILDEQGVVRWSFRAPSPGELPSRCARGCPPPLPARALPDRPGLPGTSPPGRVAPAVPPPRLARRSFPAAHLR